MVIILFHFFFISSVAAVGLDPASTYPEGCRPTSCKRGGPSVRFPFRLKGLQSDDCGYPGFTLTCNNNNHTVLELPQSVKLLVKHIDYKNQRIQVYAEDGCVQNQLQNLTLSSSPFNLRLGSDSYYETPRNSTLFECSEEGQSNFGDNIIRCLSTKPGFYVKYTDSDYASTDLLHCRRTIDLREVPEALISDRSNNFYFNWSRPGCGYCELRHQVCRRNETNPYGFECFDIPIKHMGLKVKLMISGLTIGGFFVMSSLIGLLWMYHLRKMEKDAERKIEQFLEDYKALKPSRYSYADIKRITFQFKEKLGQGGYGTVFKGTLSNDVSVAVKVLNNFKGNGEEFINEVGSMGRIHHVNVTRLVGFCADGYNRALVYEYLPNESLEKFIFEDKGDNRSLSWEKTYEIALGIAKGIEYLHQGCEQRILHFDIKPHNILLDDNFNPKISDFGLAKLCSKEQSAVSMTAARGTMGYIAPEVLSRNFGNVSYKSDVYSFGMMLLEMVGGRKNIDVKVENISQVYFPEWVYNRLDKGEELGIRLEDEEHDKIAKKLTIVGLWCIQWYPVDRPSMNSVVQMIEGEAEMLTVPPNPFASKDEMKVKMPINRDLPTITE
ncbi:putative RING/U-box superfamily protein [Hibiscus syriacus]|uniref:RING/U-box superfamily protein n=1 Tax=Hibiscus syriacus TaxID=106335 RepID=A0A6A2YRH3_HIBSY|nr:rust resistance kinase Lr10-like [Hibiscus syriacus]KAE8682028.1 putative RING/U-box superfamily protein [Hibiscus syriacus]